MSDVLEFKENDAITADITDLAPPEMIEATDDDELQHDTAQVSITEMEALRSEIASLKEALAKKTAEADIIRGQLGEFSELFPNISPEDIPEEVWKNTVSTGSLAAAYALYHRKSQIQRNRVRELNQKNAALSTGKVGVDSAKEFFTPSEVRTMSRDEVHKNYSKILDSMKKWN